MQLQLAEPVVKRLLEELHVAGSNEIGGLLMGEHVRDDTFRVIDISVQRSGGSGACFVRDPAFHQETLQAFFARTGSDYARFNYLGEWHSHPAFEPLPSGVDIATMQSIVEDSAVGVHFLILLVVRLGDRRILEASAAAFIPQARPMNVSISSYPPPKRFRVLQSLRSLYARLTLRVSARPDGLTNRCPLMQEEGKK
jgi:integrative and conjugative element protein (TIGR02256 family)